MAEAEIMTDDKTELIPLEQIKTIKDLFLKGDGLDKMLDLIEKKAFAQGQDASTDEGREVIRSTAYKISRSKTFLDDKGKDVVAEEKKKVDAANSNRKKIRQSMDDMRTRYRKPLTTWEVEEKAREEDLKKKEKEKVDKRVEMLAEIIVTLPFADVATMSDDVFDMMYSSEKIRYEAKLKEDAEALEKSKAEDVKRKADEEALETKKKDLQAALEVIEKATKALEKREQEVEDREKELEDSGPDLAKEEDTKEPPDEELPANELLYTGQETTSEVSDEESEAAPGIWALTDDKETLPETESETDIEIKTIYGWVDEIKRVGIESAPAIALITNTEARRLVEDIKEILVMFDTNIRIRIKDIEG